MKTLFSRSFSVALLAVLVVGCAAHPPQAFPQDSGGDVPPRQAAYDVTFYDLALTVHPQQQTIEGTLTAYVAIQDTLNWFVLDLDDRLRVDSAQIGQEHLAFERRGPRIWIDLPRTYLPGDSLHVAVAYHGAPRVAPNPPWEGGFTWATTPSGQPWIATSVQSSGADLWWPVKDYASDEPDSMALHFTVPKPLVAASNGVLRDVDTTATARTYHWFVSTPINNYAVALNVAPYTVLDTMYTSVMGASIPVRFYVLPAHLEKAQESLPHFLQQVRFLEKTLGPYPFRTDKLGIAEAPFLGMEHQTLIAYGSDFTSGGLGYDQGFDALFFHELAHEWYGNLVTAADWKDFWIHEGFATYFEALYAKHLHGKEAYRAVIQHFIDRIDGGRPISYHQPTTAQEITHNDVYFRGAATLHTLRSLIGDEAFFEALRRMVYPTERLRRATEGRQTRLVSTADFVRLVEEAAGRELDWFFDAYLYDATLPHFAVEHTDSGTLRLRWQIPGDEPFPLPVTVRVAGELHHLSMEHGAATLPTASGADVTIDPRHRVLTRADVRE